MNGLFKWGVCISVAFGLHLWAFSLQGSRPAERLSETVEIDIDILQDASLADPNRSNKEIEKERLEKEERLKKEQERLDNERLEKEKVEKERLEKELLEEQQKMQEQKLLEERKLKEEAERLAEKKRLDAIAWKKKQAELAKKKAAEAYKKKKAAEYAKKKTAEAYKKKKAAEYAKKKAAEAYKKKKAAEYAKKKAASNKAYLAKKITKGAYATSKRKPTYPRTLMRKNVEGKVVIKVVISSSGKVSKAWVSSSSGHSSFDQSALKAAYSWKYKPAKNGLGMPVSSTKTEVIYFKLR